VRNVIHIERAHNSLSQSQLMDRGLRIVPVNGNGIKIYDKAPRHSAQGRGSHVGMAGRIEGLFRLDVTRLDAKVAGKRH
jgi:hypothetical protein